MSRKNFKRDAELPYHITARTNNSEWFSLDLSEVWEIFEAQLYFVHHAYGIRIHSFVLMSNHFHFITSDPQLNISKAMRWLMTETSREIGRRTGRKNKLWGQRNYKCLISTYHYYLHAYKYVYRNPVAARMCDQVQNYRYSTLHGLMGKSQLIIPVEEDLLHADLQRNLIWLNTDVKKEDWESVRSALRKSEFKLRKDPNRNQKSELEHRLL